MFNTKNTKVLALSLVSCSLLSACGAGARIANIGKPPEMSQIANPQLQPGYQPISMPMPTPKVASRQPNSLWDTNRKSFFKDQRATDIGDILTVLIEIDDKAKLENSTERTRSATEGAGLDAALGFESRLGRVLPNSVDNANLVGAKSTSRTAGDGTVDRKEKIEVKLAATVTQILPNGNFVVQGKQEVRLNFEKRILQVTGVIRPEDISIQNTIPYDQVAEARITYGGEGQITDVQQPRYGQQLYDIIFPF